MKGPFVDVTGDGPILVPRLTALRDLTFGLGARVIDRRGVPGDPDVTVRQLMEFWKVHSLTQDRTAGSFVVVLDHREIRLVNPHRFGTLRDKAVIEVTNSTITVKQVPNRIDATFGYLFCSVLLTAFLLLSAIGDFLIGTVIAYLFLRIVVIETGRARDLRRLTHLVDLGMRHVLGS